MIPVDARATSSTALAVGFYELRLEKKVFRRITREYQFRKRDDVGSKRARAVNVGDNLARIVRKVADSRIDLSERDPDNTHILKSSLPVVPASCPC